MPGPSWRLGELSLPDLVDERLIEPTDVGHPDSYRVADETSPSMPVLSPMLQEIPHVTIHLSGGLEPACRVVWAAACANGTGGVPPSRCEAIRGPTCWDPECGSPSLPVGRLKHMRSVYDLAASVFGSAAMNARSTRSSLRRRPQSILRPSADAYQRHGVRLLPMLRSIRGGGATACVRRERGEVIQQALQRRQAGADRPWAGSTVTRMGVGR